MSIRAVVWNEYVHEQSSDVVAEIYPNGIHGTIADALNADPEEGLPKELKAQPLGGEILNSC